MKLRVLEQLGINETIRRKAVASFVSRLHRVRFDCAVQTSNSYRFNFAVTDRGEHGDLALPLLLHRAITPKNPPGTAELELVVARQRCFSRPRRLVQSPPPRRVFACLWSLLNLDVRCAADSARWSRLLHDLVSRNKADRNGCDGTAAALLICRRQRAMRESRHATRAHARRRQPPIRPLGHEILAPVP